ncbi:hypothetical protein [Flagellimonas okinawensis]|uniref:Lipoprotein n=1 Tax=Flagellimonas okinawensis TaxID=3031324 RepID=A0ABT5XT73_9FLAO|nr:hypothetical protein [[Muricauda] okinawensis]MDF0709114.1 hypothetical protein [[Muricauda] okinawensis]
MKNLLKLSSILMLIILCYGCSRENEVDIPQEQIILKFELNNTTTNKSTIHSVTTGINFENNLPKLVSKELTEVEAVDFNGQVTYAYVLKSEQVHIKGQASLISKCSASVSVGYAYNGSCFVYGALITGTDCSSLFVACGINCIGFDDVCPGWNEGYAINPEI